MGYITAIKISVVVIEIVDVNVVVRAYNDSPNGEYRTLLFIGRKKNATTFFQKIN